MELPSRQQVKHFLTEKAMEFITASQKVPCTRKSRRQAARELAKRQLKNTLAGRPLDANV